MADPIQQHADPYHDARQLEDGHFIPLASHRA